jgi:hypothetical protein
MNANHDDHPSGGNEQEFLRLAPDQRRTLNRRIAGLVAGAIVVSLFLKYWFTHGNALQVMQRMNLMCYLLSLGLFAIAGYLGWYARRIHQARLYPPPGGWLLGDTRILRGDAARIQARWVGICAAGFAALAIYAAYLPHSIASIRNPPELLVPAPVPSHG